MTTSPDAPISALLVHGMTCQGCVRSVTAALQQAVPGLAVDVELASGTVLLDRPVPAATLRDAVENAGFDYAGPAPAQG